MRSTLNSSETQLETLTPFTPMCLPMGRVTRKCNSTSGSIQPRTSTHTPSCGIRNISCKLTIHLLLSSPNSFHYSVKIVMFSYDLMLEQLLGRQHSSKRLQEPRVDGSVISQEAAHEVILKLMGCRGVGHKGRARQDRLESGAVYCLLPEFHCRCMCMVFIFRFF